MTTGENHVQQERWVLISYVLMLLTLVLGVTWLISLWLGQSMLSQPHEVWLRSHQLWIIRSCVVFFVLILLSGLFSTPLIWFSLHQIFVMVTTGIAALLAVVALIWLLYRSCHGLKRFMQGKAVY